MTTDTRQLIPGITLRHARQSDSQAVIGLVTFVHEEYRYEMDLDRRDRDLFDIPAFYPPSQACFFVLEDESGRIVGAGAIKQISEKDAELCRFYFYPEYRARGIGKRLLDELIAFARTAGYRRLILETHTDMVEADRFYRKHGFTEIPVYSGEPPEYSNLAFEYRL